MEESRVDNLNASEMAATAAPSPGAANAPSPGDACAPSLGAAGSPSPGISGSASSAANAPSGANPNDPLAGADGLGVNLSEILFKPKHNYIETSLISNSGCPLPGTDKSMHMMGSYFRSLWYRPLNRFSWANLGGNLLDIDEALANIVMGNNERTRPECFDTIEQYGPGNWIYEFSAIGQKRVLMANKYEEAGDKVNASHNYRMGSRYFAIAAYPNLKGDVLAAQASLLGYQAYRKIFNDEKLYGAYREETFKVRGETVTGYLHSVDTKTIQPCVIVLAAYGSTATDFYRIFSSNLRKMGIAIFVVEMPGLGSASKIVLDAETSVVLEAALEHLRDKVKFINGNALGALGFRLSANAVARCCIMRPDLLKAAVMISPALHNIFTDQKTLNMVPLAERSSIANRLNLDASHWETIVPQLQILSLKKQGLISYGSKIKVDTLSVLLPVDIKYNDDRDLIEQAFCRNKMLINDQMRVSEFATTLYHEASEFFNSKLH